MITSIDIQNVIHPSEVRKPHDLSLGGKNEGTLFGHTPSSGKTSASDKMSIFRHKPDACSKPY